MNSVIKAVTVGAIASIFHLIIMLIKSVSVYSMAAVVLQYIIGSVAIFHVPIKITGWKKGLAVGVFCALPLAVFIPHYDPSASFISATIVLCFFSSFIGLYGSRGEELFPLNRVVKAVTAGAITGAVHVAFMFYKGASEYSMAAVNLQYIIASLLIFFVPVKLTGWLKGFIVGELVSVPLVILIPHCDPSGSILAGFILSGISGSLVGIYSTYKEKE